MKKKRNNCLNFLKGISCIGVVLMHCSFPEPFGKYISYLCMFAVPIFFMISGYFSYYDNREIVKSKLPKKMLHILRLIIISEMFYGIWMVLKKHLWLKEVSIEIHSPAIIGKLFIGTFFNGTLWFLYALFWSYVVLYIINKFDLYKIAYKLSPMILVAHVVFRTYVKSLPWYNVIFFRNFIFYGLPFVMVGNYIHKSKEIVCEKITNKMCLIGTVFGICLTVVEYLTSRQALDFYIGTIIMSCVMFIYAIKNPEHKINSILCRIGDKLSLYIYVLHILVIEILTEIEDRLNISFFDWIKPIVVILISITLAYVCKFIFTLKSRKEVINYGKN